MNINFKNESDKNIILTLNGMVHFLKPHSVTTIESNNNEIKLSLTTEDEYSSESASKKRGLTLFHRFITVSGYNCILDKDSEILLTVETARGNNLESYQRVIPATEDGHLSCGRYTVKNESEVRCKLKQDEDNRDRFDKKLGKTAKAISIGMRLDDIIGVVCGILFALILSGIVIFSFKEYPIATVIVVAILLIVGVLSYKLLKKLISLLTRGFEKLLDKHGDKLGDALAPCADMPMELFVDDNSYFDNTYISAVFEYSTRRK